MKVLVFLASGILEDGSVVFFSYEFFKFFWNRFFSMKVFVLLASGILEDGSVAFFHVNLYVFLEQNGFFNESVGFFAWHFGRRFCGLFSYEFTSFFGTELFFQ